MRKGWRKRQSLATKILKKKTNIIPTTPTPAPGFRVLVSSAPVPFEPEPRSAEDLCRALEYADKVPERARAQYITNVYAYNGPVCFPQEIMDSYIGIDYAFNWEETPEGAGFWKEVMREMEIEGSGEEPPEDPDMSFLFHH